jgi:hypothetical protein
MNTTWMRGVAVALAMAAAAAGMASAKDVRDGNAMVTPARGDRYTIDGSTMGKAELFGYLSDLKDTDHLTGVVLKRGGDDEQRRVIGSIAKTLGLASFEQDGGDLKPIAQPAAAAPAPPIEPSGDAPAQ